MSCLLLALVLLGAATASDTLVAEMHASWTNTPLLMEARCGAVSFACEMT